MPSTYTSNNKIQKIATGEQSGTWGSTTNTNFDLFDTAIDGFVSVTLSGTTHTLNIPDGSAGDGRNKVLVFTGTLAATNTVSVTPNTVKKHYYVQNNTTGGQSIIISQGSGSTVTVKNGYSSIVYLDGAGSSAAVKEVLTSLKLTALLEATGAVLNGSSSGSTTLQASAAASGTLTLPAATDTLVGKATTDTFTNKTFDTAGTGNVLRINGTQVSAVTGTGSVVLATSPTLVTPLLGTPTSGTLTNCTGLPVSTGISGLGTNVATFLATPSSANLASAVTDETGTGALVFANTPTLVTPVLGTPTSGTLTNCTGLPISTGVSGLGSNVATFLATPSSANLAAAVTDETGSGALVFGTSPTIATPTITTSAVIPLVNGGTAASSTLTLQSTSGTGTSDAILFKTGSQQERMRITTDGAVGIGVSPSYTFEVRDAGSNSSIAISNSGVTGELLSSITNATGVALISSLKQLSIGVSNAEPMVFKTSNSERMRILSTGEVGIGVTTANTRLHVSSDVSNTDGTGFDQGQLFVSDSSLDSSGLVLGYRYQSGVAEYARIQARSAVGATNIAMQAGGGNVGIGTSSPRSILNTYVGTITGPAVTAGLTLTANYSGVTAVNSIDWNYININASPVRLGATFNSDGVGMEMVFYTSTAYTVTGSERMRINKDGNVGIGTTPSYRLHVYNNADAVTSLVHLAKNNGGSADGVYILDDRGFSGVNSGKTFRVLTRDDGGNDTGAIASFESLSQTVLRVGIDGRVGVGTGAPATSAKLDIDSTTGALLVPRMTTTQRDALTAANGMIIYNTTTNTMQGRINGAWTDM